MEAISAEIGEKMRDACEGQPVHAALFAIFGLLSAMLKGKGGHAEQSQKVFARLLSPFLNDVPGLLPHVIEHAKAYSLMKTLKDIADNMVSPDKVED